MKILRHRKLFTCSFHFLQCLLPEKKEIFLIGELTRDDRDTRDADIQLTTYEISAQAA